MSTRSGGAAGRPIAVGDLVAAAVCLGASAGFLVLARALPAGHSTGDVGPGALPQQIAVFGLVCSACYLLFALRGSLVSPVVQFAGAASALSGLAIFAVAMALVPVLGLAGALALSAAALTLLFAGPHRLWRAAATGAGLWVIAAVLFGKVLGVPLP